MTADTIIETTAGQFRGLDLGTHLRFAGIRYATAERFCEPVPVGPDSEIVDATDFGPIAHQRSNDSPAQHRSVMSEDCLRLNLWTPDPGGRRPVLVWLHGGAFTSGSGNTYDGAPYCARDLVVVTVNYRLGAFGFLAVGTVDDRFDAAANNGLRDVIAALGWVRAHIASFGGDHDRVTIAGESAGAALVAALLAAPQARGLFHRAIAQSTPAHFGEPWFAPALVDQLAGVVDPSHPTGHDAVKVLLEAPADRIVAAHAEIDSELAAASAGTWRPASFHAGGMGFHPTVDGDVLPHTVIDGLRSATTTPVPLLIGSNRDEGTLFRRNLDLSMPPDDLPDALAEQNLPHAARVVAAYRARNSGRPPVVEIFGHRLFWYPTLQIADALVERGSLVWVSEFAWESPAFGGVLGAAHALDLPFEWDQLGEAAWRGLVGDNPPQTLADTMVETWATFAHGAAPGWEPYGPSRPTMVFDTESRVEHDPRSDLRKAWIPDAHLS